MKICIETEDSYQNLQVLSELKLIRQNKDSWGIPEVDDFIVPRNPNFFLDQFGVPRNEIFSEFGRVHGVAIFLMNRTIIMIYPEVLYFAPDLRFFIILHEFMHASHNRTIKKLLQLEKSDSVSMRYINILRYIADEYFSDRKAFKILDNIFKEKSFEFLSYFDEIMSVFNYSQENESIDEFLISELSRFGIGNNDEAKYSRIDEYTRYVGSAAVNLFSYSDHYNIDMKISNKYVQNKRTFNLLQYIKEKSNNNDFDLKDGMSVIKNFVKLFGYEYLYAFDKSIFFNLVGIN